MRMRTIMALGAAAVLTVAAVPSAIASHTAHMNEPQPDANDAFVPNSVCSVAGTVQKLHVNGGPRHNHFEFVQTDLECNGTAVPDGLYDVFAGSGGLAAPALADRADGPDHIEAQPGVWVEDPAGNGLGDDHGETCARGWGDYEITAQKAAQALSKGAGEFTRFGSQVTTWGTFGSGPLDDVKYLAQLEFTPTTTKNMAGATATQQEVVDACTSTGDDDFVITASLTGGAFAGK